LNKEKFVFEISKLRSNKNFLKIDGLKTDYGDEIFAKITFNVSYKTAIEESLRALNGHFPSDFHYQSAKNELVGKFKSALISMSEQRFIENECDFLYPMNDDGQKIEGIRVHRPSSTLHIFAFFHKKIISDTGNPYGKGAPRFNPILESFKKICPALRFESVTISPWQVANICVESLLLLEGGGS